MPDALSAASLLLAAIALLYSAWSNSIDAETKRVYSTQPQTKKDEKAVTRAVLWWRAIPVTLAAALAFAAFAPRALKVTKASFECLKGAKANCIYDDVSALFLLTETVLLGLAIYFIALTVKIVISLVSS